MSVLFARADSCYFDLAADVWDRKRDASNYAGPNPVVAHPPCRGWGRLSHLAKPRDGERNLGRLAVEFVRTYGGVLEHPHASKLWQAMDMPRPGFRDAHGGFTILLDQGWFGHPAPKPTWVYVCGMEPSDVPPLPVQLHRAAGRTLKLSPADRERTPPAFAAWLLALAAKTVTPAGVVTLTQGVTPSRHAAVTPSGRKRRSSYLDLADALIG